MKATQWKKKRNGEGCVWKEERGDVRAGSLSSLLFHKPTCITQFKDYPAALTLPLERCCFNAGCMNICIKHWQRSPWVQKTYSLAFSLSRFYAVHACFYVCPTKTLQLWISICSLTMNKLYRICIRNFSVNWTEVECFWTGCNLYIIIGVFVFLAGHKMLYTKHYMKACQSNVILCSVNWVHGQWPRFGFLYLSSLNVTTPLLSCLVMKITPQVSPLLLF